MIWDSIFFLFFKIFSIFILFSNSSLLRSESKFYSSRSEVFKSIVLQNFLISSWSKILFVFSDFFFPISSLLLNLEVLIFICSTESSSTCSPVALSPPAMAADPTTGGGGAAGRSPEDEVAESFIRAAPPLRARDRVAGVGVLLISIVCGGGWGAAEEEEEGGGSPGWSASPPAARRCPWSSGACDTSTTSAPAREGPRPPSMLSNSHCCSSLCFVLQLFGANFQLAGKIQVLSQSWLRRHLHLPPVSSKRKKKSSTIQL